MLVILAVSDLQRSVAFWRGVFGWKPRVEVPVYVELAVPGGSLGLYQRAAFGRNTGEAAAEGPASGTTSTEVYVRAPDLPAAIARLEAAGAPCLSPLAPRGWGDEAAYYADPDGNVVVVARSLAGAPPLDPGAETLDRWLQDASAWVLDHLDRVADAPSAGVTGEEAERIAQDVSVPIAEEPLGDLAAILPRFGRAVEAGLRPNGPGYVAYVPGGGLPAVAIADLLADVANRFTGIAATSPALVRLEADVLRWLAAEIGYGPEARGLLTSGGSLANFGAVVTARHAKLGEGGDWRDAVVYASSQVHHTVVRGVRLAGIPESNVRAVPVDDRLRMRVDALEEAIAQDRGKRPFLVVASAGTTNTGAIDPLHAIADVCAREGLWMHVDGAYGGAFVLCDEGKRRLDGIGRADSVAIDPHKGMFLPYGTGCLLVKDGRRLAEAHHGEAAYLQDIDDDGATPSPTAYGPELSRPYRGLRLWLPLVLHGARAFREALAEKLALAEVAHAGLAALGLAILDPPQLSVVAFRLPRGPGEADAAWDARNEALLHAINARGRVWLSSTRIGGRFVLRVCVLSFRTHRPTIDALLEDVRASL
jgi:aromatic-L-amino-acid decarboxylase